MSDLHGEQLRQQYLAAMGITSWLPVTELPGAAPSPKWHWLDEHTDLIAEAPARVAEDPTPTVEAAKPVSSPAARIEVEPKATEVPTEEPVREAYQPVEAPKPPSETNPVSPIAPPRFRLALVAYPDALVICQMPMDVLQSMPPEHQMLIQRILASIGLGEGEAKAQMFAWPIVNNPNVDQSLALAQSAIAGQVERMQASTLPLIVFGGQMPGVLGLPETLDTEPEVLDGRACIVGPTLNELIAVPGLKRELWINLQRFKVLL